MGHLRADRFDFDVDRHTLVAICTRVMEGADIVFAFHDEDGGWQFVCAGDHEDNPDDPPVMVCLECTVARDPSLNELADLPRGYAADRPSRAHSWDD